MNVTNSCEHISRLLDEVVDGRATDVERAAVDGHLRDCADCRGLLLDLQRVHAAAATLGPVQPPEQVWRDLAARLAGHGPRRPSFSHWMGLAATLALVASGVYIAAIATPADAPVSPTRAVGNATAASVVEVDADDQVGLALASYDRAITQVQVGADLAVLDPAIASTLRHNLQVIDLAIRESRTAFQNDPHSASARDSLTDALRQKASVLRVTTALVDDQRHADQPDDAGRSGPGRQF